MYQQAQKGTGQPVGLVRVKGKAYTLTVDQADASGEVVTGIILVHSVPAYVLFDSSATHCFIHLSALVSMIYHVALYTGVGLLTLYTGNGMMSCNKVCSKCPIVICGKEFITNFLLIDNCDFDIILGMDWLSQVHALIDCQKKIQCLRFLTSQNSNSL